MLDLNDVALFVQVVQSGSFAQAARRVGMPSNTLSRRIQALEAQVESRLLQRSTRKLTLTQTGQAFYDRSVAAVQALTEAGQQLMTEGQGPAGTLRIAAMADFFDFFPMAWVADFLEKYPRVKLDFVLSDTRADLIADRIDIAFRGGVLPDSGYVGRQLIGSSAEGLVATPGYLERRGVPQSLEDLANHDCVCLSHPSGTTRWRLTGPGGLEHDAHIVGRFTGNTAQVLRKATLAGLGIALLPPAVAVMDLKAGRVVRVLPDYHLAGQGLHVLYPSRQHLPLAVSAFLEMVMQKLDEHAFPAYAMG